MNTLESNYPATDGGDDEGHDYARRNPLEIGVQLRNLLNRGDFLTVHYRGGQLVTCILDVDARARTFVFDWGSAPEQNRALLAAPDCQFHASPEGVRVEFSTATPRRMEFEGRPAFETTFPEVLFYMQRREYFRVNTPVLEPCVCIGEFGEGQHFVFEVHDLSLGGLGVRTTDERAEALVIGTRLANVTLDLRGQGLFTVDLCLVGKRAVDANGMRLYHLGFRFESLPGSAENTLQRYITQLEMKRRALARP